MRRRSRSKADKPKKRFVFKGSRGGQPKIDWPNRLKAIITVISETEEELTGGDIITAAIDTYNEEATSGITDPKDARLDPNSPEYDEEAVLVPKHNLFLYTNDSDDPILDPEADEYDERFGLTPISYRNKHASSVIWGQKDRLLQALADKRNKSHKEAKRLADEFDLWDLIDEVEIVENEPKGRPKAETNDEPEPAMVGDDMESMEDTPNDETFTG